MRFLTLFAVCGIRARSRFGAFTKRFERLLFAGLFIAVAGAVGIPATTSVHAQILDELEQDLSGADKNTQQDKTKDQAKESPIFAARQKALITALQVIAPEVDSDFGSDGSEQFERIRRGRALFGAQGNLDDLAKLTKSQREDLAAYYKDLLGRAQKGADKVLDSDDRRALAAFQDYARQQGVTPPPIGEQPSYAGSDRPQPPAKDVGPVAATPSAPPAPTQSAENPRSQEANPSGGATVTPRSDQPASRPTPNGSKDVQEPSISQEAGRQLQDDLLKNQLEKQVARDNARLKQLRGDPKPELPGLQPETASPSSGTAKVDPGAGASSSPGPEAEVPQNRFTELRDKRRNWLPAAAPPGQAEVRVNPELFLEGNWQIEWRNHPDFRSAKIWIVKGLMLDTSCSTGGAYESCRDPQAPLSLRSAGAEARDGRLAGHAFFVQVSPGGGAIEVIHNGAEGGPITTMLRRQSGEPDVLIGKWINGDGKTGTEIWRREPRPEISRFECRGNSPPSIGLSTQPCTIEVLSYPPRGAMRGNLPGMEIDVFGSNMRGAGPLPIFLDWRKTSLEVERYCYLYERPFTEGQRYGCASWGDPHETYGNIIGVRVRINFMYGVKPGLKTVWLGGKPVRFNLLIPDLPKDVLKEPAKLESLEVIKPSGEIVTAIEERTPFQLKATFSDAPADEIVTVRFPEGVAVPTSAQPAGSISSGASANEARAPPRRIILQRTDDPKIFRSGPIAVNRVDPAGDQDRLSLAKTIPGHNPARSTEIVKKLAGTISVQQTADSGGGLTGVATVAEDGRRVALTLTGPDGERQFESLEIDAEEILPEEELVPSNQEGPTGIEPPQSVNKLIMTVRFKEVLTVPRNQQPGGGGSSPQEPAIDQAVPVVILSMPRSKEKLTFTLDDRSVAPTIIWRKGSGRFQVNLASEAGNDRLAGPWFEETEDQNLREAGRHLWTRGEPKIAGVLVLENQIGAPSVVGAAGTPETMAYPFDSKGNAGGAPSVWRTLFVYGRNLPKSGDPIALSAEVPSLAYTPAFIDRVPERRLLDQGWSKLGDKKGESDAALLVRVKLKQGVTPGVKKLTLNGQPGFWPLIFSDQLAIMRFVRESGDAEQDATDVFYTSDIGFVELKYEVAIPFEEIRINLFKGTELSPDGKLKDEDSRIGVLLAKPVEDGTKNTFRTSPIHLYRSDRPNHRPPENPKAQMLDVRAEDVIKARLSDRAQGITIPKLAQATVYASPDEVAGGSPLWEDALRGVAVCLRENPDDGSLRDGSYARQKSKAVSPLILRAIGDKSITLSKGDHAAAILIREEFVKQSSRRLPIYLNRSKNPVDLKKFREAARRSGRAETEPFWSGNKATFVKKGLIWNTNEEISLWQTLDIAALAKRYNIPPEVAEARANLYTQKALTRQYELMQKAIDRANAAGDCKLDELLVIAGHRTPPVVNAILPRLVKLEETANPPREVWVPDNVARGYVKGLYVAGGAVRALDQFADLSEMTALTAAAILVPVGASLLAEYTSALAASSALGAGVAADLADVVYLGGKGLYKYFGDNSKLEYALGASPALGNDFYSTTAASRQTGLQTLAGLVVPGGFALRGLKGLRAAKGAELLKARPSILNELDTLTKAERGNLAAYLKSISKSAENLRVVQPNGGTRSVSADLERILKDVSTSGAEGGAKSVAAADQKLLRSIESYVAPPKKAESKDVAKSETKAADGSAVRAADNAPAPSSSTRGGTGGTGATAAEGSAVKTVDSTPPPTSGTRGDTGGTGATAAESSAVKTADSAPAPTSGPRGGTGGTGATAVDGSAVKMADSAPAPISGTRGGTGGTGATAAESSAVKMADSAPAPTSGARGDTGSSGAAGSRGDGNVVPPRSNSVSNESGPGGTQQLGSEELRRSGALDTPSRSGNTQRLPEKELADIAELSRGSDRTTRLPIEVPSGPQVSSRLPASDPGTTLRVPVEVPSGPQVSSRLPASDPGTTPRVPVEVPSGPQVSSRLPANDPGTVSPVPVEVVAPDAIVSAKLPNFLEPSLASNERLGRQIPAASPYAERALSPVKTAGGTVDSIKPVSPSGRIWETDSGQRLFAEEQMFGHGGFANVVRLMRADGTPSGLVRKNYTPWTGKFGGDGVKFDPSYPLTRFSQQKMVQDSIYGSSLLKDNDILQAEIVGYGMTSNGAYMIQRQVGYPDNLPRGVSGERILEDRLKDGQLSVRESEAVSDLFRKLDEGGIGWEDPNWGNIFLREYRDGRVVAGIHDTDRIALWDDLDLWRDDVFIGFRDSYATNPEGAFRSMPPGGWGNFNSAREFNYKMREAKGYWQYNKDIGYHGGVLGIDTIQNRFRDLADDLPPNWRKWVRPPPGAAPKKQGLLWPGHNVVPLKRWAGSPTLARDRRTTPREAIELSSLAMAA